MARKAETNGIADTLRRLLGDDTDRSLVAKFAGRPPLQAHRVSPKGRSLTLKRSDACDNLIKNLVALDSVFNSQDFSCRIAEGAVSAAELHREIAQAQARLQQKLRAYAYWVDRLASLEALLQEQPSLEAFALEDRLSPSMPGAAFEPGTPYALRAVQLLEKVEEQGRSAVLSAEQLSEKAWALYRLGLQTQADQAARQAIKANPQHAEAWMLLALGCIEQKRVAQQDSWRYQQEREWADPASSHERWAEEMRDEADGRAASALWEHRAVIFPALHHWPFEMQHKARLYRYREHYEVIRNWCIDWLFALLQPQAAAATPDVDLQRAYAANGLAPEFAWTEVSHLYRRWGPLGDKSHGLSALEIEVAAMIHQEWAELVNRSMDFAFFQRLLLDPQRHLIPLKLLHIGYVLGLPAYAGLRDRVVADLQYWQWPDIQRVLNDAALRQVLTTHCSSAGLKSLSERFDHLGDRVSQEQHAQLSRLKSNLWRQSYHHAFVRNEFAYCRDVALAAQRFLEQCPDVPAPEDLSCNEAQQNTLGLKHWKYLELRAAVELPPSREVGHSLLSVSQPVTYFAEESHYLIQEFFGEEFGDDSFYVAPYGDSILRNGRWRQAVLALADSGELVESALIAEARLLVTQLGQMEEPISPESGEMQWLTTPQNGPESSL